MSRGSSGSSYGHKCMRQPMDRHAYVIMWVTDHKHVGSRLRHPRVSRRYTDEAGARRFCAKWGCKLPAGLERDVKA
jgi:hypothetical protein